LVNPEAFSKALRIQGYVEMVAEALGLAELWQLRLAAMLSQLGCVSLPPATLAKLDAGESLSEEERQIFDRHPEVGGALLAKIPRLERVAAIVAGQMNVPDLATLPGDARRWPSDVLGAQILRVAVGFDRLVRQGLGRTQALEKLKRSAPAALVEALNAAQFTDEMERRSVRVSELRLRMILDDDVRTRTGLVLARRGLEVSETIIAPLHSFAQRVGVVEPLRVLLPQRVPLPTP
jgi:hypothetical protein